ncbi:MAG: hypothetical protein HC927_12575, partial [Deltaproteobacteria bacterium]|nr:hypothetical protein [Deltaproteobacteria bacterium]
MIEELGDLVGDELVDDRELGLGADRDVLDLVLAVEVGREHLPARERDLDGEPRSSLTSGSPLDP